MILVSKRKGQTKGGSERTRKIICARGSLTQMLKSEVLSLKLAKQ